jgi:hypothetical protein
MLRNIFRRKNNIIGQRIDNDDPDLRCIDLNGSLPSTREGRAIRAVAITFGIAAGASALYMTYGDDIKERLSATPEVECRNLMKSGAYHNFDRCMEAQEMLKQRKKQSPHFI